MAPGSAGRGELSASPYRRSGSEAGGWIGLLVFDPVACTDSSPTSSSSGRGGRRSGARAVR
jgi:hypothetical protein